MLNLASVAHALGGEVSGHQVLCPGPGHSRVDRSVAVRLSPDSPDGVLVWSHGGSTWQEAKDHVLSRLGIGRERRKAEPRAPKPLPRPKLRLDDETAERRRRALACWHAASDPAGSVAERYLASRGLVLPDGEPGAALRFHAACAFGEDRVPAMVAAMRCIRTDRLMAVHRTALTSDGAKVGRKMLGPVAGCAVKLDADEDVHCGLIIGEGIETTQAGRQLGLRPAWALGSVGAIRVFPVLVGIEALTILVETGDGGASEEAARVCGQRWHAAGRQVLLIRPRIGGDLNDAIRETNRP